jgi:hypothetical protein
LLFFIETTAHLPLKMRGSFLMSLLISGIVFLCRGIGHQDCAGPQYCFVGIGIRRAQAPPRVVCCDGAGIQRWVLGQRKRGAWTAQAGHGQRKRPHTSSAPHLLTQVGFCEAAWEGARRATIKAHPTTPHPPSPLRIDDETFQKSTFESTAPVPTVLWNQFLVAFVHTWGRMGVISFYTAIWCLFDSGPDKAPGEQYGTYDKKGYLCDE